MIDFHIVCKTSILANTMMLPFLAKLSEVSPAFRAVPFSATWDSIDGDKISQFELGVFHLRSYAYDLSAPFVALKSSDQALNMKTSNCKSDWETYQGINVVIMGKIPLCLQERPVAVADCTQSESFPFLVADNHLPPAARTFTRNPVSGADGTGTSS